MPTHVCLLLGRRHEPPTTNSWPRCRTLHLSLYPKPKMTNVVADGVRVLGESGGSQDGSISHSDIFP